MIQSVTEDKQHNWQHGTKWIHSLLLHWSPWNVLSLCLGQQQCLARPPTSIPSIFKGTLSSSPWECSSVCHGGFQAIGKPAFWMGFCIWGTFRKETYIEILSKFMGRCPEIKLVTEFFLCSYLNTTCLLLHVLHPNAKIHVR